MPQQYMDPHYQWLTGARKMPLEANSLKGWICAHNKQCKQELIRTPTYKITAGASVTREINMPPMVYLHKELLPKKQIQHPF
jgi:hypothetical protein